MPLTKVEIDLLLNEFDEGLNVKYYLDKPNYIEDDFF